MSATVKSGSNTCKFNAVHPFFIFEEAVAVWGSEVCFQPKCFSTGIEFIVQNFLRPLFVKPPANQWCHLKNIIPFFPSPTFFFVLQLSLLMCFCVCVCEREGEGERVTFTALHLYTFISDLVKSICRAHDAVAQCYKHWHLCFLMPAHLCVCVCVCLGLCLNYFLSAYTSVKMWTC